MRKHHQYHAFNQETYHLSLYAFKGHGSAGLFTSIKINNGLTAVPSLRIKGECFCCASTLRSSVVPCEPEIIKEIENACRMSEGQLFQTRPQKSAMIMRASGPREWIAQQSRFAFRRRHQLHKTLLWIPHVGLHHYWLTRRWGGRMRIPGRRCHDQQDAHCYGSFGTPPGACVSPRPVAVRDSVSRVCGRSVQGDQRFCSHPGQHPR